MATNPAHPSSQLTPYLICQDARKAMAFYEAALGAREDYRLVQDDGRIGHAAMTIGATRFSLADEFPEMNCRSPASIGGTTVNLHLYVDDVDAAFEQARAAGARVLAAPHDEFYGDRVCRFADPSGHIWMLATRKEDVSPAEMQRRMKGM